MRFKVWTDKQDPEGPARWLSDESEWSFRDDDLPLLVQGVDGEIVRFTFGRVHDSTRFQWNPFDDVTGRSWKGRRRPGRLRVQVEFSDGQQCELSVQIKLEAKLADLRRDCLAQLRQVSDDLVLLAESDLLGLKQFSLRPGGERDPRSALAAVEQLKKDWEQCIATPLRKAVRHPHRMLAPVSDGHRLHPVLTTNTSENRQLHQATDGLLALLRQYRDFVKRSLDDAKVELHECELSQLPLGLLADRRQRRDDRQQALDWIADRMIELTRIRAQLPAVPNWRAQPFRMTPALRRVNHYYQPVETWQSLKRPSLVESEDAALAEQHVSFIYERWVYVTLIRSLELLMFQPSYDTVFDLLAMDRYAIRFEKGEKSVRFRRADWTMQLWYEPRLRPIGNGRMARDQALSLNHRLSGSAQGFFTGHDQSVTPDFALLLEQGASRILIFADATLSPARKAKKLDHYTDYAWLQLEGHTVVPQSQGWIFHPKAEFSTTEMSGHRPLYLHPDHPDRARVTVGTSVDDLQRVLRDGAHGAV